MLLQNKWLKVTSMMSWFSEAACHCTWDLSRVARRSGKQRTVLQGSDSITAQPVGLGSGSVRFVSKESERVWITM